MVRLRDSRVSALTTVPRSEGCWAEATDAQTSQRSHLIADARGESRTLTGLPPGDFESPASAIPPLGLKRVRNLTRHSALCTAVMTPKSHSHPPAPVYVQKRTCRGG